MRQAVLPLLLVLPWSLSAEPDFNRDIRPILAENCFHCHGPDEKARKSNLRLDTFEGATKGGEFADPIVPGKPDDSEVIKRIFATDAEEIMPPPKSKRKLSNEQKRLLSEWIKAGAKYEQHWAWQAPARLETPKVKEQEKVANPIDSFVLRRLEQEQLTFSPPASRRNLLRRVYLDLIGLPPSPKDIQRFEKASASAPDAWRRAYAGEIDRLLASKRFGEHWARPWLDLARYADSNGFQADQLRPSWAYRDWVIEALNNNMPYDQFTIEQLAGDLLPNATLSQKVATGFHRTVTCNVEAGVSPEGNRVNQVVDRVNTTGTVWLGITMECAQCHDHKYDPFSMEDYYSLFAFFNNTPLEVQLPSNKTDVSHDFVGPYLDLPLSAEQKKRADGLDQRIAAHQEKRQQLVEEASAKLSAWEKEMLTALENQPSWTPLTVSRFQSTGGADHKVLENGSVLLSGKVPDGSTYTVELTTDLPRIASLQLEALTHPSLPGKGPGRGEAARPNFVLQGFNVELLRNGKSEPIKLKNARADFSQDGWPVTKLLDGNPKTGWAINPQFGKPHWAAFDLAQPLENLKGTTLRVTLVQNWGMGRVLGNIRLNALPHQDSGSKVPDGIVTILKKPAEKRNAKQKKKLEDHFLSTFPDLKKLDSEMAQWKKQRGELKGDRTLVMVELKERRTTHILTRGNFHNKEAEVSPNTPALFPELKKKEGSRLDLARWLVRRDNPLTARVAVNRWWAELFGNGIVATLEDFGTQSEPPTHPDLLDWLAVELMESGWDMKELLRTIVLSNTYQQSSRLTRELKERDPRNLLLARAPRFRMDAERLRDNTLTISGLLSTKMYGKPVMPYQPPGLWRQTGRNEPKWQEQKDENRWRRGIYIVYRRAAPYPSMVNFDAPDRAACTVNRARTNTPLQALTLLNDPAYVEAALAFADRVLTEAPPESRIDYAFQLAVARTLRPKEREVLDGLLQDRLSHYGNNPKAADEVLNNKLFVYQPKHNDKAELASWLFLTNVLLNLDETMTRN